MTDLPLPAAVPWYKTGTFRGVLVFVITGALARFHVATLFSDSDIAGFADDLIGVVGGAVGAYTVAHARITQSTTVPPPIITLSQPKADAINGATIPVSSPKPPEDIKHE
jgi:hypothetical protein